MNALEKLIDTGIVYACCEDERTRLIAAARAEQALLRVACKSANRYLAEMAANGGPKPGWEGIEEWSQVQQQLSDAIRKTENA